MPDINAVTRKWIRNASDERAATSGCRFDEARARHVCHFVETYLRLFEGGVKAFALMAWQRDVLSRIFGWVKWSDFHKREIRRFRKASLWAPKKNGKSPLAAAVGLYLLTADGEMGQKVFSSAKDGKQAAIIHNHARMMVRQSPDLSRQCKINESTGRILHLPTNSFYEILTGDNILSQEGLNGSVIVDETHVVDDRLAKVIEYMGASRSEPLQFEISTAGDNPQSYGRRQYDYGKNVEAGIFPDDAFFFQAFEAPQDATDEELDDPALWRLANPSMGQTINEEEFGASLERAKRSLSDWTTFKRYRFNIWATSENPWLRMSDWAKCRQTFTEASLAGKRCTAGLDLARTRDLTALALIFDDGEEKIILPYFWLPEARADELQTKNIPMRQWAEEGFVKLTPGEVCDYRIVEEDIGALSKKFRIGQLAYDEKYAEELTQNLEMRFGIERWIFPQTIMEFAGPTAEFERLVIAGKMHHNAHPVLTWQIGHVKCKTDANLNKRPVKQEHGDHRTIDGVVAGVMALGRSEAGGMTIYERSGRGFVEIG